MTFQTTDKVCSFLEIVKTLNLCFRLFPYFGTCWGNKQIIDYNIMYINTLNFTLFASHILVNKFPQYKRIGKH